MLRGREQEIRDGVARGVSVEKLPGAEPTDEVVSMRMELLSGQAKLENLATQYGERYPEYKRQLAVNQNRERALAAELRKSADRATSLRQESERRQGEIRAALDAQRARLLEL